MENTDSMLRRYSLKAQSISNENFKKALIKSESFLQYTQTNTRLIIFIKRIMLTSNYLLFSLIIKITDFLSLYNFRFHYHFYFHFFIFYILFFENNSNVSLAIANQRRRNTKNNHIFNLVKFKI